MVNITMPAESDVVWADSVWAEMLARLAEKQFRMNQVLTTGKLAQAEQAREQSRRSHIFQELERERSRIARELHAGAGQPLAGIRLNLDILDDCTAAMPPAGQDAMQRLHRLAESALAEVRAVSHRLHPPDWQVLNAGQAIRRLLSEIGAESIFAEAILDVQDLPLEPGHSSRIALYRCAQECIANVVRHSGATRLEVSLRPIGNNVELRVADNGRGIGKPPPSSGGLGLNALRTHAAAAGGTCNIESGAAGTVITVTVPARSQD